jgi:hypothetical protein
MEPAERKIVHELAKQSGEMRRDAETLLERASVIEMRLKQLAEANPEPFVPSTDPKRLKGFRHG